MTKAEQIIEDFKKSGKGIGTIDSDNRLIYIEARQSDWIDLINKVLNL